VHRKIRALNFLANLAGIMLIVRLVPPWWRARKQNHEKMDLTKTTQGGTGSFRKLSRKGKDLSDGGAKTRARRHDRRKTCEALHRYLGQVSESDE
jgi:hypothetical protein